MTKFVAELRLRAQQRADSLLKSEYYIRCYFITDFIFVDYVDYPVSYTSLSSLSVTFLVFLWEKNLPDSADVEAPTMRKRMKKIMRLIEKIQVMKKL